MIETPYLAIVIAGGDYGFDVLGAPIYLSRGDICIVLYRNYSYVDIVIHGKFLAYVNSTTVSVIQRGE